jgi:hypothetical protein
MKDLCVFTLIDNPMYYIVYNTYRIGNITPENPGLYCLATGV